MVGNQRISFRTLGLGYVLTSQATPRHTLGMH